MRSRRPIILPASALALAALAAAILFVHEDTRSSDSSHPNQTSQRAAACPAPAAATSALPDHAPISADLESLKLVSYYPPDAAWTNMWTDWQPAEIGRDLCGIAALGANAVRIILQPQVIGYPTPTARMLDRLRAAVDLASARGLRVQLTLFDWWSGYTDFDGGDTWARAVLRGFRDDPRIVFCELKNEINSYETIATVWVRHELPVVRAALGSVPVTVSVSGNSPAASLIRLKSALGGLRPDFYDMHYYGTAGAAFTVFSQARSAVAPVPLFIGETGDSSIPDPALDTAATASSAGTAAAAASPAADSATGDADQDLYLRAVEWAARQAGLPYAAPWTYSDLTPSAVPSLADPIAPSQRYFGLVRTDGTPKPAARSIQAIFAGRPISTAFGNTFDAGHDGLPDAWQATGPQSGNLEWDAAVGHTALGSARMSGTAAGTDPIPAFYTTPVVQPTHAGQPFRLSAWAAAQNATGTNRLAISWYAVDGTFVQEDDSRPLPPGSSAWTRLTVTARLPPGAAYAEVRLQSEANTGTVWFDDASFTPLDRPD